jgi:hypothetical protein
VGGTIIAVTASFGISLVTYYLLIWFFGITTFFGIDPFFELAAIIPIKSYSNAEADKAKILKENKDKSGIYMLKIILMVNAISEALII